MIDGSEGSRAETLESWSLPYRKDYAMDLGGTSSGCFITRRNRPHESYLGNLYCEMVSKGSMLSFYSYLRSEVLKNSCK